LLTRPTRLTSPSPFPPPFFPLVHNDWHSHHRPFCAILIINIFFVIVPPPRLVLLLSHPVGFFTPFFFPLSSLYGPRPSCALFPVSNPSLVPLRFLFLTLFPSLSPPTSVGVFSLVSSTLRRFHCFTFRSSNRCKAPPYLTVMCPPLAPLQPLSTDTVHFPLPYPPPTDSPCPPIPPIILSRKYLFPLFLAPDSSGVSLSVTDRFTVLAHLFLMSWPYPFQVSFPHLPYLTFEFCGFSPRGYFPPTRPFGTELWIFFRARQPSAPGPPRGDCPPQVFPGTGGFFPLPQLCPFFAVVFGSYASLTFIDTVRHFLG